MDCMDDLFLLLSLIFLASPHLCNGIKTHFSSRGTYRADSSVPKDKDGGRKWAKKHNVDFKHGGGTDHHGLAFFISPKFCAW
jgi:hypothetical protein